MKVQSSSWKQWPSARGRFFFLMKRTKAEESPCPEFSFLHLRCGERTRESAPWVWSCYGRDEAQAESAIIIQLSKWEERLRLRASHYTEQQRVPLWILRTPTSGVADYFTFWFCKTGLRQPLPPSSGTRMCQRWAAAGYGKIIRNEPKPWCRFGRFREQKWLFMSGTREVEEPLWIRN